MTDKSKYTIIVMFSGYAEKIASEVRSLVTSGKTYEIREDPPALCSKYPKPSKEKVLQDYLAHIPEELNFNILYLRLRE